MNGITAIVADRERCSAPRPIVKPAPAKSMLLFWLARRTLCAADLAERTGMPIDTVRVHLTQLKLSRNIFEVYRRVVEYDREGPGRKRHVVRYYKARVVQPATGDGH